jgi:hypothetical protein
MTDETVDCETAQIVFQKDPGFLLEAFENISRNRDVLWRLIPPGAASFLKIFFNPFQEGSTWSIFRKIGFKLLIP